MKEEVKYKSGEITIIWKPNLCIHSAICAKGLPDVFKPREKPWVKPEGSTTQTIKDQIDKCPSKALSYISE